MHKLVALLAATTFTLPALADNPPVVAIHGFDKMDCRDWLGSEDHPDVRQQYIGWIRGVVTGYNYANPDNQVMQSRMPSDFGLIIFVDNYCHRQKVTSVAGAAFALILERRGSAAVSELPYNPPAASITKDTKGVPREVRNVKESRDVKDAQDIREVRAETDVKNSKDANVADAFKAWQSRQSADMRSLDKSIQMKIFLKESALEDKNKDKDKEK